MKNSVNFAWLLLTLSLILVLQLVFEMICDGIRVLPEGGEDDDEDEDERA